MFSRILPCLLAALVLLAAGGCPNPSPAPVSPAASGPPPAAGPLVLLVVDDVPLAEAIAREWKSRTEKTLDVQHVKLANVLSASRLPGDVIVFPAGHLGQLAERELIVPLADEALAKPQFDRPDIFDQVRLRDIAWGNRTLAAPLGSPQLLLAYRRDVFERHSLAPPKTWSEYQTLVQKLAAMTKEGDPPVATIEPLADGWAGQMLLARAAAYVTHRDQVSPLFHYTTLEPLITSPPYVRALEELVAARRAASADRRLTPAEALEELFAGHATMAITWPAPGRPQGEPGSVPLEFALLPGSTDAFSFGTAEWEPLGEADEPHAPLLAVSGRLAAVTATAANFREAQSLVLWMAGREVSPLVSPASSGTAPFRQSHMAEAGRWAGGLDAPAARSYGAALAQSASLQRFLSLRLPGRDEYLAALDAAVASAIAGEKTPADALAAASARWQEITSAQGLARQQQALRRDLGQESLP
jgi:multiple sugar transport system substrate-binding protein